VSVAVLLIAGRILEILLRESVEEEEEGEEKEE
jgi:hypothetical protein